MLVAFEAGEEDADPTVGDLAEGLAVGLVPFAASRRSGGADYIRAAAIGVFARERSRSART